MKYIMRLISFNIIISFLFSTINDFSRFSFLNCSFVVGMIYLLFGGLCFVWEKGFFDITIFSFNKISQQIQKKKGILSNDQDITIDDYISRDNSFRLTNPLLYSGTLASTLCIILSFYAIR